MEEQAKSEMNKDVKKKKEKIDQAIMLIVDVGRNTATSEVKNQKSFFESAREYAVGLIEREIFSQGKHWIGVILLGSKNTDNSMAGKYEGINLLYELRPPTWDMIRKLPEQPSNSEADWIDALLMAEEHFKKKKADNNISYIENKLVVLVTNFQTPIKNQPEAIHKILNRFKEDEYQVNLISPNLEDSMLKRSDLEAARQFVENTKGRNANFAMIDFDFAMHHLTIHRKKTSRPWNVDLCIGENLKIPVSAYIRVKDEPVVKTWVRSVKDPLTGTSSATESYNRSTVYSNPESQIVVDNNDIIVGYYYGHAVIPVNEQEKKNMSYESGDKCISVYGFTYKSNVHWQNLNGNNLMYVFGRKEDKKAQDAIRCLVECLHETECVGIVRQVYNNNNAPKMCALFPVIDTDNYVCLSMVAVCFKQDIKHMHFPFTNTKRYTPDEAQVSAFKDLIKAMDLTKAYDESYDDEEAFPVAQTVSPYAQYVRDCIVFRALNPNKPLPKPREEILSLFRVPPTVAEKAKAPLEKLKSILKLKKVEKKQRKEKKNFE